MIFQHKFCGWPLGFYYYIDFREGFFYSINTVLVRFIGLFVATCNKNTSGVFLPLTKFNIVYFIDFDSSGFLMLNVYTNLLKVLSHKLFTYLNTFDSDSGANQNSSSLLILAQVNSMSILIICIAADF